MNDEEVAFRIVRLYFEEIAKLGFKRTLDLDQMIDAYFYTLKKLKNKDVLVRKAMDKIEEKELINNSSNNAQVSSSTTTSTTEVTRVSVPKEKTITQIIEEN